jgi:catechol 2,3-dioxygenase-like lactoylglutathione lyase family enzyme
MNVKGIHHLSAMTGNAPGNFDFYTKVLGMRLVKKTVNQDDTKAYHLFYGDERGNPGTELTFFDFPGIGRAKAGVSSISGTSLRVADDKSLRYWLARFAEHEVKHSAITVFAGRNVIFFEDPEGQQLALVSDETNTGVSGEFLGIKALFQSLSESQVLDRSSLRFENQILRSLCLDCLASRKRSEYLRWRKDKRILSFSKSARGDRVRKCRWSREAT